MIVTEEQAKTLWCAEARVGMGGIAANMTGNMNPDGVGYGNIYEETRCKASGCMMWRKYPTGSELGYCGKAGVPLSLRGG